MFANPIFACAMAALLLAACQGAPSKTKEQVMQERLQERIGKWKDDMNRKCRNDVEDKATVLADSIIIANAKSNRDTSIHLLIPGRPYRPDYKPPTDSVPVEPILK
jgi:hypothetical protein